MKLKNLSWILLIVIAIFVIVPEKIRALSNRNRVRLISWSIDGLSVLIANDSSGPEGGRSVSFRLISAKDRSDLKLGMSNDMSPGDGSTPQRVWAIQCIWRLKKLKSTLNRLNFKGIAFSSGGCFGKNRSSRKLTKISNGVNKPEYKHVGTPSHRLKGDLWFKFSNKHLFMYHQTQEIYRSEQQYPPDSRFIASLSPAGHLLLVILHAYRSEHIIAVFHTQSGKALDMKLFKTK